MYSTQQFTMQQGWAMARIVSVMQACPVRVHRSQRETEERLREALETNAFLQRQLHEIRADLARLQRERAAALKLPEATSTPRSHENDGILKKVELRLQ